MESDQSPQQPSVSAESNLTTMSSQPTTNMSTSPLWKDLLIPVSIVIAGAAIGVGLYFSGNTAGGGGVPTAENVPSESFQERVTRLAEEAGVSESDLNSCIENRADEMAARVQEDFENASATGGGGTPWSVVIGPTGKTYPLNGAVPAQAVQQIIELARSEGDLPNSAPDANTDAVNPVTEADWIKGSPDSAVTIVEYSDYDCPFCGRFHSTMDQIVNSNDDVAWVYRHSPIDQLHPNARTVAVAAECIGELEGGDAFWTFTDAYFAGS